MTFKFPRLTRIAAMAARLRKGIASGQNFSIITLSLPYSIETNELKDRIVRAEK